MFSQLLPWKGFSVGPELFEIFSFTSWLKFHSVQPLTNIRIKKRGERGKQEGWNLHFSGKRNAEILKPVALLFWIDVYFRKCYVGCRPQQQWKAPLVRTYLLVCTCQQVLHPPSYLSDYFCRDKRCQMNTGWVVPSVHLWNVSGLDVFLLSRSQDFPGPLSQWGRKGCKLLSVQFEYTSKTLLLTGKEDAFHLLSFIFIDDIHAIVQKTSLFLAET